MAVRAVLIWCLIGFFYNIVSACGPKSPSKPEIVCESETCWRTAADQVISKVDTDADPCSSFYNFACGKFVKQATIPDDQAFYGTADLMKNKVKEKIKRALEEESPPDELHAFKLAKKFYRTCMNTDAIENKGLKPLQDILTKLGTWPVLEGDNWVEENFSWSETIYKINDAGLAQTFLLPLHFTTNRRNNPETIHLMLKNPTLEAVMTDKIFEAYYDFIVQMAVLLGADESRAKKELWEAMLYEESLKNCDYDVGTLHPLTVRELDDRFGNIPWRKYFQRMLPANISIHEYNDEIFFQDSRCLASFRISIGKTPKRTVANYLMYQIVLYFTPFLDSEVRQKHLELQNKLAGVSELPERSSQCLDIVSRHMSASITGLYVRKHFAQKKKQQVTEMFQNLKAEFRDLLLQNSSGWLDAGTIPFAVEKLDAMKSQIGYPEVILDDAKLEAFYSDLVIDESDFFHSFLNVTRTKKTFFFNNLRAPANESFISLDEKDFFEAYHTYLENKIYIPFGAIETTFDSDSPNYQNYGRMGWIIAQKIALGFYETGRRFYFDGFRINWWAYEIKTKYYPGRKRCTSRRYSNFYVNGVGYVDGEQTAENNLADGAGIKIAYLAYQNWTKRNGLEGKLPEQPFTPNQLFWIGAANTMCRAERKESLSTKMSLPDMYSPAEFRVDGTFMNLDEFSNDFNCMALFSYMNPVIKCSVY